MILVIVAILSIIVAFIRKGSFSNIKESGLKAWILLLLSVLVFAAVYIGDYMAISFIQNFAFIFLIIAYALLIIGLLLNLNVVTFIMLLGTLLNFVVVFINGGKMPLSENMINIAGLSIDTINASAVFTVASQSTHLPVLGGIVPIPLPGILAQIISPGTIILAIGLFFEIQNLMLGVVYEYDDNEDEEDDDNEETSDKTSNNKGSRKQVQEEPEDEDDFDLGKDYTVGDIDIHETDRLPNLPLEEDDAEKAADVSTQQESEDETIGDEDIIDEDLIEESDEDDFQNTAAFFDTINIKDEENNQFESDEDDNAFAAFDELTGSEEDSDLTDAVEDSEEEELNKVDPFDSVSYQSDQDDSVFEGSDELSFSEVNEDVSQVRDNVYTEEIYSEPYESPSHVQDDPYKDYTAEDLTLKKDALIQAKEVIENDLSRVNKEPVNDEPAIREKQSPVEVDTDSPFIIVNGRIVENPYYKFRRGVKVDSSSPAEQIGSGVYVMKSRNPSIAGRPSFAPASKMTEQNKPKSQPSVKISKITEDEDSDDDKKYEKVEMQIGDVQIKFWKKDNDN